MVENHSSEHRSFYFSHFPDASFSLPPTSWTFCCLPLADDKEGALDFFPQLSRNTYLLIVFEHFTDRPP